MNLEPDNQILVDFSNVWKQNDTFLMNPWAKEGRKNKNREYLTQVNMRALRRVCGLPPELFSGARVVPEACAGGEGGLKLGDLTQVRTPTSNLRK